ncbi:MAG: hypothetical protein WBF15_00305, partial [Candidatus Sulfotelmatobacter sp.]
MTRTEQQAAAELARQEPDAAIIKMTATGNPDFIVIPRAALAQVRFVEVKAGSDTVHAHQYAVHEKLRSIGTRVDVARLNKDKTLTVIDPASLGAIVGSRSSSGPFGKKGSPEYRAKMATLQKIVQNRPEVKARVSERTKAALSRPECRGLMGSRAPWTAERRALKSAAMKKYFEDPEARARNVAALNRPEVKVRRVMTCPPFLV